MVRILDSDVIDEIRKSQIELYELKNVKDGLISMFNNFSQKIINENFFDYSPIEGGEFSFNKFALRL